ncbi:phosphatase PAP2 family protein [Dyadobacter sp. NIV53]|uniref:phosphatase PAP2 family protein n=1 Tax=Dyadobacter sp. NIV53 TaxID=2861765 RepID=UPI001E65B7AB|nr:phosphatase PAP2 family protein [Dyadobacter sp. NIV53]
MSFIPFSVSKVLPLSRLAFLLFFLASFSTFSQQQDSVAVNRPLEFKPNKLYVPGILLGTGTLTSLFFKEQIKYKIAEQRNKHFGNFQTSLDDYLEYASLPIAYGLDVFGVKSKNDFLNKTAILIKGEILFYASTNLLKIASHELRPDGSDHRSFPSGHTAQAFATATFLAEEYKERLPWIPYAAYTMAGTTGLLRIANNKHYIGDVLFGAGLGLLSMKTAYWTHRYKWGKNKKRDLSTLPY